MKLTLFDPHQKLTPEITRDMLLLVSEDIPLAIIERWTPNEQAMAYDWAAREHLRASDNIVKTRPKPWFIQVAAGDHPAVQTWKRWLDSMACQDLAAAQAAIEEMCGLTGTTKPEVP